MIPLHKSVLIIYKIISFNLFNNMIFSFVLKGTKSTDAFMITIRDRIHATLPY